MLSCQDFDVCHFFFFIVTFSGTPISQKIPARVIMRRAQASVPPGGAPKVLLATPMVPSLTEPAAAFATRHRTSAEFRAKLLFNLQKSSETVSKDVDFVVLGSSAASSTTQSTPNVVGLHCQLPCALQAAGYPCLSSQCDDNTHVQFQRAMESSATEIGRAHV